MGRLLELKHVNEVHVKTIREKEKTLIRRQQVELQLEELQKSLPGCKQEKKKAHKEVCHSLTMDPVFCLRRGRHWCG